MDDDLDKIRAAKFHKQQKEAMTIVVRKVEATIDESKKATAKAKSVAEKVEAEVECFKFMLDQVEKVLISKIKKATDAKNEAVEANNEVVKINEEMEKRIVEVGHLAIEAFKNSKELNDEMPALRVLTLKLLHLRHLMGLEVLRYKWMQLQVPLSTLKLRLVEIIKYEAIEEIGYLQNQLQCTEEPIVNLRCYLRSTKEKVTRLRHQIDGDERFSTSIEQAPRTEESTLQKELSSAQNLISNLSKVMSISRAQLNHLRIDLALHEMANKESKAQLAQLRMDLVNSSKADRKSEEMIK
ncbi:hypothetical protein COCNU_08G001280 [Cocos nucifera]|uniref:Uncharacterized protein n=1 Tax=Cocos nucifera TaxID=13894 RepID=A0A8K0IHA0_COCNU|nr:hypothetical protein COCNU_08G001280 [Cocos nucifera]